MHACVLSAFSIVFCVEILCRAIGEIGHKKYHLKPRKFIKGQLINFAYYHWEIGQNSKTNSLEGREIGAHLHG